MKYVLDSSVVVEGFIAPSDWEILITPGVDKELKKKGCQIPLARILAPEPKYVERVKEIAKRTGDLEVLSPVDVEVIALALQENATILTDDYAIQNVASHLGVKWVGVHQSGITEKRKWKWRCESCGRYYSKYYPSCPVCGGKLRRVRAK